MPLEKIYPNLINKVDPVVETEIYRAFQRIYEYVDMELNNQKNNFLSALRQANLSQQDINKIIGLLGTNDSLKKNVGVFVADGYINIHDNAGHTIKILTTSG